jgi:hypothetical protein
MLRHLFRQAAAQVSGIHKRIQAALRKRFITRVLTWTSSSAQRDEWAEILLGNVCAFRANMGMLPRPRKHAAPEPVELNRKAPNPTCEHRREHTLLKPHCPG